MTELYPEIHLVHIWAVVASGSLFAFRTVARAHHPLGVFAGLV